MLSVNIYKANHHVRLASVRMQYIFNYGFSIDNFHSGTCHYASIYLLTVRTLEFSPNCEGCCYFRHKSSILSRSNYNIINHLVYYIISAIHHCIACRNTCLLSNHREIPLLHDAVMISPECIR